MTARLTLEEAKINLARFLQHFPARQVDRDAVIISDTANDLLDAGVSLCALVDTLRDLRLETRIEKPFQPPGGEIVDRAKELTLMWDRHLERLERGPQQALPAPKKPEAPPASWTLAPWADLPDDVKTEFWQFICPFPKGVRQTLCTISKHDYQTVLDWHNAQVSTDAN